MDPLTIGIAIFLALGAVVTVFAIITFANVVMWFGSQVSLSASGQLAIKPLGIDTSANIGFTLAEKISEGKYKVIQGVYNKEAEEVLTGRVIEGEKLDEKLGEYHQLDEASGQLKERLVVYC